MAGVVESGWMLGNKIEWSKLSEQISKESLLSAVHLTKLGGTIHFNKSITDDSIEDLLEPSKLFMTHFANIPDLSVNFESHSKITNKSIAQFVQTCSGIKKINLKTCALISDIGVREIANHCKLLEEIDLSWCDISEQSLFYLAQGCKNLKSIGVRSCYITDRSVDSILQNCLKLKLLSLPWCKSLTDKTIDSILIYNQSLMGLDLRGNKNFTTKALSRLFAASNCLNTVHLKRCAGVTGAVVRELAKSGIHLQKLNLRGCYQNFNISNDDISYVFKSCPNLVSLDMAWHYYLDDTSCEALADNCSNLEALDISGCSNISDKSLMLLASKCAKLKKIVLFNNLNITLESIISLKNKGILIKRY